MARLFLNKVFVLYPHEYSNAEYESRHRIEDITTKNILEFCFIIRLYENKKDCDKKFWNIICC